MAKILLTNQNQEIKPVIDTQKENLNPEKKAELIVESSEEKNEQADDFGMFPEWDVIPPGTIVNPRKRKMQ